MSSSQRNSANPTTMSFPKRSTEHDVVMPHQWGAVPHQGAVSCGVAHGRARAQPVLLITQSDPFTVLQASPNSKLFLAEKPWTVSGWPWGGGGAEVCARELIGADGWALVLCSSGHVRHARHSLGTTRVVPHGRLVPVTGNRVVVVVVGCHCCCGPGKTHKKCYCAIADNSGSDFRGCTKLDSSGPLCPRETALAVTNRCGKADRQPFCCSA